MRIKKAGELSFALLSTSEVVIRARCIQLICCRKEQEDARFILAYFGENFIKANMIFSVQFNVNNLDSLLNYHPRISNVWHSQLGNLCIKLGASSPPEVSYPRGSEG